MTAPRSGPPPKDGGPTVSDEATTTVTLSRQGSAINPDARAFIAGLRRRGEASRRLPVLDSGHADPWTDPDRTLPIMMSDNQLDGWRDTAGYLDGRGLSALVPDGVLRALWRRGGHDRALAEALHRRATGGSE